MLTSSVAFYGLRHLVGEASMPISISDRLVRLALAAFVVGAHGYAVSPKVQSCASVSQRRVCQPTAVA